MGHDARQTRRGPQIAFMNAGGIRADLTYDQISGGEQPGEVTYGEAFTVQPFGNSLVTMTLTGAQIDAVLEQQFTGGIGILQVSDGLPVRADRRPRRPARRSATSRSTACRSTRPRATASP